MLVEEENQAEIEVEADDEITETPEIETEAEVTDEAEQPESEATEPVESEEEAGDLVVSFGDDEPEQDEPKAAPEWVKKVRAQKREDQKRIKELQSKLAEYEQANKPALGPKPTLESCEYDTGKFESELEAWHARKQAYDAEKAAEQDAQKAVQEAWQADLDKYQAKRTVLKVSDYDEAEEIVQDELSVTQQGVLISGAEDPALLVYALAKNPKKLAQLKGITDPVKFSWAASRLESQMKTGTKRAAPRPEKTPQPSGGTSGYNATLERLRQQAAKTGDFSKVHAYKRANRR